jgi:ribosomal RNA-processing protein 7
MEQFEAKEEQSKLARDKAATLPDEDGFITVHRKRKRPTTAEEEREAYANHKKKRTRGKKRQTELKHFYRFQIREEKRERLAELRQNFEQDKARVQRMKQQRKFRPV